MTGRWVALVVGIASLMAMLTLRQLRPDGQDPAGASGRSPGPEAELTSLRERVARLEAELARAHESNRALEDEIDWLREERRDLAQARAAPDEPDAAPDAADPAAEEAVASSPRFDEAALLDAGFDPRDVEALQAKLDGIDLERLYLRDAADREGWRGTERWRRERRAIDAKLAGLRDEFGEELYDWGMYASGRPNRVRVAGVLRGSEAAEAGLMPGDVIVSHDDRRIYGVRDLRAATRAGQPGETAELRVLRDGEILRVFLPRGPIGVTPEPITLRPALR